MLLPGIRGKTGFQFKAPPLASVPRLLEYKRNLT